MSESYSLKIEFTNPTNIESEVPSQQKLREPIVFAEENKNGTKNEEDTAKNGEGDVAKEDDATFVPVMTVTKEEAVLTKGDLKLQKVSVTENISENEEKKPRSRIPMMKFRQAAEEVKNEKRRRNQKEQDTPTAIPRRSSIPRLKKRTVYSTQTSNNEETTATKDNSEQNTPPEDEFDKIYDEIIHTDVAVPVTDITTLDKIKIDDAKELEHSFEEIIHDYEENKVQPIDVKQVRSRIPLVKQKSLPDENFAKKLDRRSSLKNIPIDDDNNAQNNITKSDKKYINEDDVNDSPTERFIDFNKHDIKETVKVVTPILSKNETQASNDDKAKEMKVLYNKNEVIETISDNMPDSSKLVKQISMERYKIEGDSNKPILEANGVINNKDKLERDEEKEKDRKIPVLKGKVSSLVNKIAANDQNATMAPKIEYTNQIPKKKSIMSKIAVFNRDKDNKIDRPNDFKKIKTFSNMNHLKNLDDAYDKTKVTDKLGDNSFEKLNFVEIEKLNTEANNVTPPNTPMCSITEPTNENIIRENDIKLLQVDYDYNTHREVSNTAKVNEDLLNENNVVEINYPTFDLTKEIHKIDVEDIQLQTSEVIYPDEDLPLEAFSNSLNDEAVNKEIEEEIVIPKGKVSRIISRIVSHEDTLEPKKEPVIEVPIKKSVSSRIAMFERQTTVDNIAHKPRIIDEVLKAQPPRKLEPEQYKPNCYQNKDNVFNNESESINTTEDPEELSRDFEKEDNVQKVLIDNNGLEIRKHASIIVEETIKHVSTIIDIKKDYEENDYNEVSEQKQEAFNSETENLDKEATSNVTHNREVTKEIVTEKDVKTKGVNVEKELKPRTNEYSRMEDRLRKIQSRNDDGNIKKTKSTTDLQIEEAVKGKVHQMIVRMNSRERLEVEKKSSISVKEQPRKKSVLEKIALFEQKLISSEMNSTTTLRPTVTPQVALTPAPTLAPVNSTEDISTDKIPTITGYLDDKYQKKIEGLLSAKETYGVMKDMQYISLANGEKMPVLALGTALMDPILLPYIVGAAIDLGFRAIDTAYIYGNEQQIGDAIQAKIEDGTVKREDLFIMGKLWSTFHRRDLVQRACEDSLRNLRLDYFDLYLIHNPMSFKEGGDPIPKIANVIQYSDVDYLEAWYGMEDLVSKGLVKSIGVSNFNSEQVGRLVEKGKIKPVINQVECHPYLNQQRLHDFCANRNVKLMCFGALGSKGTPQEYKATSAAVIDDPLVKVMAAGKQSTPAQLLLKYQITYGHPVVVKSSSAAHLWDNLQAVGLKMEAAELDALHALNRNKRTYVFKGMGDTHKNYPFKIAF